jgi:hypothetical protein
MKWSIVVVGIAFTLAACATADPPAGANSANGASASSSGSDAARAAGLPFVRGNLDTFSLTITLTPADGAKPSLRTVALGPTGLREPPAKWLDGTPQGRDAVIGRTHAEKLVSELEGRKFFSEARQAYSVRGNAPMQAPALPLYTAEPAHPSTVRIQVVANNETHYRYFTRDLDWNADARVVIDALRASVDGDAAKALEELAAELPKS